MYNESHYIQLELKHTDAEVILYLIIDINQMKTEALENVTKAVYMRTRAYTHKNTHFFKIIIKGLLGEHFPIQLVKP